MAQKHDGFNERFSSGESTSGDTIEEPGEKRELWDEFAHRYAEHRVPGFPRVLSNSECVVTVRV